MFFFVVVVVVVVAAALVGVFLCFVWRCFVLCVWKEWRALGFLLLIIIISPGVCEEWRV